MGRKTAQTSEAYKVRISENALLNIDEITGYIALGNQEPLIAIKVGDKIFETIEKIGVRPYSWKECDVLPTKSKMYRQARCFSWYIVYRIAGMQVTILGVIHASRNPATRKSLRKVK